MADQATETSEIDAPVERILAVLLDLDAYPTWARDLKGVQVESRDDQGRAREVTFRAAALTPGARPGCAWASPAPASDPARITRLPTAPTENSDRQVNFITRSPEFTRRPPAAG